jgi:hypothetical protein
MNRLQIYEIKSIKLSGQLDMKEGRGGGILGDLQVFWHKELGE